MQFKISFRDNLLQVLDIFLFVFFEICPSEQFLIFPGQVPDNLLEEAKAAARAALEEMDAD